MRHDLIRKLRKTEGLTLVELGEKTGYTPSFLSQIERGLKIPSLEAMRKIANYLNTSVIALLDDEAEATTDRVTKDITSHNELYSVIHSNNRRKFILDEDCAEYELITPQTANDSQKYSMYGTMATIAPNKWSNEVPISHIHEECCYILSGKMRAIVGEESYELEVGDSIYVKGFVLHNYLNIGDENLVMINFQAK